MRFARIVHQLCRETGVPLTVWAFVRGLRKYLLGQVERAKPGWRGLGGRGGC
jgi:hypothetical protein